MALAFLLMGAVLSTADADERPITIGSWNVLRLGDGNQKSYAALAQVIQRFDVVALQEVMSEDGLSRLKAAVEQISGERWESAISAPVGRSGERERYAFIWRAHEVQPVGAGALYANPGQHFVREPFSARFRIGGEEVVLATVHVWHGTDKSRRRGEVEALAEYWAWLRQTYGDAPPLLLGDFNLEPGDPAWAKLRSSARPLITKGASTLSATDGKFVHLYDNIWAPAQGAPATLAAGVLAYPSVLGWPNKKARRHVSDHAPVFVELGGKR